MTREKQEEAGKRDGKTKTAGADGGLEMRCGNVREAT